MCFHYAISIKAQKLENRFNAKIIDRSAKERLPVFHANGFTFPEMPVITSKKPKEINFFSWGLIPKWIKDAESADDIKGKTLNARSETVFEKSSYKSSISKKRCIIPATGFYEWQTQNKKKYPYYIFQDKIFSMGGIWSEWHNESTGEIENTFSIITTAANKLMEVIHNTKKRMPLILSQDDEEKWLDESLNEEQIKSLMLPYSGELKSHTISSNISKRGIDTNVPEIQEPFQHGFIPGF